MSFNREGIKKVNDMVTDCQIAQQLGQKVFTGQGTPEEGLELAEIADDMIKSIQIWKNLIHRTPYVSHDSI